MPTFITEVPELDLNVRRPVADKIIRDLFAQTNIDPNKIPIQQVGSAEAIPALNSTLDTKSNKERLAADTRIEIALSEEVVNKTNAPVMREEYPMIFIDESLFTMMKTSYKLTLNSIEVTFISKSKAAAANWVQAIQRQVSQRSFNPIHTVEYYYPVPREYLFALSKIHELREKVAGYNEDFGKWLKNCFSNKMTVITNQAGKNVQFVIKEAQTNVIGYYDFSEDPPKPNKEGTAYSISFTYNFYYERPADCIITYPIVIHNQLIPIEIRDDRKIEDLYPQLYTLTESGTALAHFNAYNRNEPRFNPFSGIAVPHYDDWYPSYSLPDYESMMRVASCIDPKQPRWVGTINDISPYVYKPHIVQYMKDEYKWLGKRTENLFLVSLHRWNQLYATIDLIFDPELNVFTDQDMNLRDMWHLDTDICNDISVLTDRALEALGEHPDVFDDYVDIFYPDTPLDELERNPDGNYSLPDIKDAIDDMQDGIWVKLPKDPLHKRLVGVYSLFSFKGVNPNATV